MKTKADTKLARMARKAIATMNFINHIITLQRRPGFVWITLAMLIGVGVTTRFGFWQLSRAQEKQDRHASIMAKQEAPILSTQALLERPELFQSLHQRVSLQGKWLVQHTLYLENRTMRGQTGFWVVTPLALTPKTWVLVQRGWIPRHREDRTRLQPIDTPADEVQINGRLSAMPSDLLQLGGATPEATMTTGPSNIRQNLEPQRYARDIGQSWAGFVVQTDPPSEGLLREWPEISAGVEKNLGYAFQWFALAAVQLLLYLWFQFVKPYRHARQHKL